MCVRGALTRCLGDTTSERHPGEKSNPPRDVAPSPLVLDDRFTDRIGPRGGRTRSVATMPAPHWFFRFMYDRESAAWERRRNEPEHR